MEKTEPGPGVQDYMEVQGGSRGLRSDDGHVVRIITPQISGLAVASLVLGVLWLWWLGSVLAVIFGHIAKHRINRSGGTVSGRGLAIAGLVLGWVGIAVGVFFGSAIVSLYMGGEL